MDGVIIGSSDALPTPGPTGPGRDSWSRRHATLAAWKASRTLDRALGELRQAFDDDSAMESEVRGRLTHATDATVEAIRSLEALQTYLRDSPTAPADRQDGRPVLAEEPDGQGAMVERVTRGGPSPR